MNQRNDVGRLYLPVCFGIALLLASPADAALLLHLDGSDPDSLIDDNGVTTWLDISGNNNHATDTGLGGVIGAPSTAFPSGLTGVQFDASLARTQMQVLDSANAAAMLDQSASGADGYAVLLVVEAASGTDWNDLIGNTSAVGGAGVFALRYGGSGGRLQAAVSGTAQDNVNPPDYDPGTTFVLGLNYDPTTQVATLASSLNDYSQDFGGRAPADFTNGGSALFLGSNVNASRFFDGKIGEVKIFDAALTPEAFADEVAGLTGKWIIPEPSSLVLVTAGLWLTGPGRRSL